MRKKNYAISMLCAMVLGTLANTAQAVEATDATPKQTNAEQTDNEKNEPSVEENVENESGEDEPTPDIPEPQEQAPQEEEDTATDTEDENMNHKMGSSAKAYNQSDTGRPLLRADGCPTIYSNDASLPRRDVVDIASWQSWMTQQDFNLLKSQGVKAICVKITEGTTYKNPYAKTHIQMARNAGLNISVYHYSHFASNAGAVAEANFFAQTANALGLSKGVLMVNDAEDESMGAWKVDLTITCNAFAQQLKNNGFTNILHYASASWVGIGNVPLEIDKMGGVNNFWIAQYDYTKPSANNLKWQDRGGAWQYSSNMILAGGSTTQILDVSIDYKGRFTGVDTSSAIYYEAHVAGAGNGWQGEKSEGVTAGTTGQNKGVEAIRIKYNGSLGAGGIEYASYVKGVGWQNYVTGGAVSGTTGQSTPLEALKIRLTGAIANKYDIYYRVHSSYVGWQGWAKNGEVAGTGNIDKKIEAYEVRIVAKGSAAPGNTLNAYVDSTKFFVTEQAHVASVGWQASVYDAMSSGTVGQSKAVEAIKLGLTGFIPASGNIEIESHIAGIGWETTWKTNGQQSGTTGEKRAIEAIRVRLTGTMAEQYDLYYRVHSRTLGWLGWAKNGEDAGTTGLTLRMEAYETRLVPKGGVAPEGNNQPAFVQAEKVPTYTYGAHVQNLGWLASVGNLGVSGTTGQKRRIEAIQIDSPMVEYRTHLDKIGWTNYVDQNQISGTTGEYRAAQALSIRLKPEYEDKFDIYYRVHSATLGWLGWTKNGANAGTAGYGLRMEAYQIQILPKNSGVAPTLSTAFKSK